MINKVGSPYRFTISVETAAFHQVGKKLEDIIQICLKSGFSGIEGNMLLFDNKSEEELETAGRGFRDAGLATETFHLPYLDPLKDDIATLYEVDRRKVESNIKRCIDAAAILGFSIGIIHPTTRKDYNTDLEGIDRLLYQLGKTLEALLRHSEQYSFQLAIENMLPYTGGRLGCKIGHLAKILKNHGHPSLGFCFDTGHALVAAGDKAMDTFHFMRESGRLIAFHLADNAGDRDSHLAPGHGRFFWAEFFRELKTVDFPNTVCVEAPPFSYGPDYSIEAWKALHDEVYALSNTVT